MTSAAQNLLWHYCSFNTFKLILKNKNILLNDITRCLDRQEIRFAKKRFRLLLCNDVKHVLKKHSKRSRKVKEAMSLKSVLRKVYSKHICWVFCLAESDDIEGHWLWHGDRSKGLSIGFKLNALLNNASKIDLTSAKIIYGNKKVKQLFDSKKDVFKHIMTDAFDKYEELYKSFSGTKKELEDRCKDIVDIFYRDMIDLLLTEFASFKRRKFSWEKEQRLILTSTSLGRSLSAKGEHLQIIDCFRNKCFVSFDLAYAVKAITIGEKSELTVKDIEDFLRTECFLTYREIQKIQIRKITMDV